MKIRDLIKRLEDIEKESKGKSLEMISTLIDDIIEYDIESEKDFRKEIAKFIDKTIEERVVEEAMYSGSIAQA